MKSISLLTVIALIAALALPNTAKAGDDEKALIGGLIGGMIIGAVLADDDHRANVEIGYSRHGGHGYWSWVVRKKWVPGHYEYRRDRYGNHCKVWVSGYYTRVREKVWVSDYKRHHRRGHDYYRGDRWDRRDRHDRDYRHHDRKRDRYDRYDRHERHRDYARRH